MSLEAVYQGRKARVIGDYVKTTDSGFEAWIGVVLDHGDGHKINVEFGDRTLIVDPEDDEWDAALPFLEETQ